MSYYQGDYYQGDYYQGDPFLGGLIGWGAKLVGKGIGKLVGKIRGTKLPTIGRTTQMVPSDRGFLARTGGRVPALVARGAGAVATGAAFGAGERMMMPPSPFTPSAGQFLPSRGFGQPLGPGGPGAMPACPSGWHYAKDGSGRLVRNRRMNVANPRALRRSLRRVAGFGKLAQRSKRDIRRAAKAIGA